MYSVSLVKEVSGCGEGKCIYGVFRAESSCRDVNSGV